MIEGISHITFIVQDMEKTASLFRKIFKAEEVYSSGIKADSMVGEKHFLVGGQWIVIMDGKGLPETTYNHVAFKIPDSDFEEYEARVREAGVEMRVGGARTEGEARSLYFYDYDNHLFELHTGTLEDRLRSYSDK